MIDPSDSDIASTTSWCHPCNTLAFTCYSNPIPRLPFSICSLPRMHKQPSVIETSNSSLPSLIQHISSRYFTTPKLSKQLTDSINATVISPNTTLEAAHWYNHLTTKKKYKPVALNVQPMIGELPDCFWIIRNILGDPLSQLPILNPNPPPFSPCGRYTQECKDIFNKLNPGFLIPEERKLIHHFMMIHQDAFAWDDSEQGHFREDFFLPVENTNNSPHSLGSSQHSYSTWYIWWSMCPTQAKDSCGNIQAIQFILPIALVLRCQERWKVTLHSTIIGATKQGHHTTFGSTTVYWSACRTFRRSHLWKYDGSVCWLWWASFSAIVTWLHDLPDPLRSNATDYTTYGMD